MGLDSAALALALDDGLKNDWIARRGLRRPRHIGQWTIGSGRIERVQALDTAGRTWQVRRQCPLPFDAIRVGIRMGQTISANAVSPLAYVAAASVPSTSDTDLAAAAAVQVAFGGNSNPTLAPSPAFGRSSWVWSDWTALRSMPRTDGGGGFLLVVRTSLYLASGTGNVVLMGDSANADLFDNWATHPDRPFQIRTKGSVVNSAGPSGWSNMTQANSAAASTSPAVMFQALYRGSVFNLGGFGDSITDGRGSYLGEGWGHPAAVAMSVAPDLRGTAFEWSNFGWSGQATPSIRQNVTDCLAAGTALDLAFLPGGSPNDVSGAIPATGAGSPDRQAGNRALMEQMLLAAGIDPILWTWMPSNSAVKAYGASDSLRQAYNDELRAAAGLGRIVADFDAVMTGVADGTGQMQMAAGTTADNIHPGDTANGLRLSPVAQKAVRRRIASPTGYLAL